MSDLWFVWIALSRRPVHGASLRLPRSGLSSLLATPHFPHAMAPHPDPYAPVVGWVIPLSARALHLLPSAPCHATHFRPHAKMWPPRHFPWRGGGMERRCISLDHPPLRRAGRLVRIALSGERRRAARAPSSRPVMRTSQRGGAKGDLLSKLRLSEGGCT